MNSLTDIKSVVIHIAGALCFVCLAAVIAISCYGGFLFWCTIPKKTSIDKIKLDNQTITVWYETDIQHSHPSVYFKVTQRFKVIVPETYVATDYTCYNSCQYDIEVAYAQDKTLMCLYDAGYQENGLVFFYNTQTGQPWPDNGRMQLPTTPGHNWRLYYTQLRDENPDLPTVDAFER